jgi:hypothetical protein
VGVLGWAFRVLGLGHEIFGFNSKVRFGRLRFRIRASFMWFECFFKGLKLELLGLRFRAKVSNMV